MENIYKSAGVIIEDKKLLVSRSKGKSFFISPGGKRNEGENDEQALIRELGEELSVGIKNQTSKIWVHGAQKQPARKTLPYTCMSLL